MLYKRRLERIDAAERVMQLIDHVEAVLKRSSPHLLHKLLFKCDQSELVTTRRLLSVPFGLALGLLLHWALVSNFPLHPAHSEVAMWAMVATITTGYVASVQARAVLLLLLPTMATRLFRGVFYVLLFRELLLNVFAAKLSEVLTKLGQTLFCFFSFRKFLKIIKFLFLIFSSISISTQLSGASLKMWLWRERVGPLGRRLLDLLTDPTAPFQVSELAKDRDKIASMLEQAHGSVGVFADQCNAQLGVFVGKCADFLYSLPVGPLKIYYVSWLLCQQLLNFANQQDVCGSMKAIFQRALDNAREGVTKTMGGGGPKAAMLAKLPNASGEWDRQAAWNDFAAFEEDLLGNLAGLLSLFRSANRLLELATVALFFWGLLAANAYHREYLSSLPFENFYIDRYFRHIDARRQANRRRRNRERLLPLRGTDRDDLVPLFSPLMTKREREHSAASALLSLTALFLLFLLGLFLYGTAALLGDYLNYLAAELDTVYTVRLFNRFEPTFENVFGRENGITEALNRLVGGLRWREDTAYWGECC